MAYIVDIIVSRLQIKNAKEEESKTWCGGLDPWLDLLLESCLNSLADSILS